MKIRELMQVELAFDWIEGPFYSATYGEMEIGLKVGDFPEEYLWNFFINGKWVESHNFLPENWKIVNENPAVVKSLRKDKQGKVFWLLAIVSGLIGYLVYGSYFSN